MAVLPWGHSRNQASGSAEKTKAVTLDWLSRSPAEPSRQAINQLMKQHNRGGSGASANSRGRSGASTPSSQHTATKSVRSGKDVTMVAQRSRPMASPPRPATPVRQSSSTLERADSASKSLFQKGGLLRRQGSKMSLSFSTSLNTGLASPARPSTSRAGFRGKDAPASPVDDDGRRPSISKPFDFAHIMHGDINAFSGIGHIDESDLASQFDAIQARYRNMTGLGQPMSPVAQPLGPSPIVDQVDVTTALPQIIDSTRSSTPPPAPPPKNSPALSSPPSDIRNSRSTENFSRPTPRSPTSPSVKTGSRPSSWHLKNLAVSILPSELSENATSKPLPQLPGMVHAVSTQDDSARLLISAPLPSPPTGADKSLHRRQSSSKGSVRHMASFPSSRQQQNGQIAQDGYLLEIREEEGLVRPHSDLELDRHACRRQAEGQSAIARRTLEAEDWEMAIDSAWDYEDEADMTHQSQRAPRAISTRSGKRESDHPITESSVQDEASSPSTPLMTMAPVRRSKHNAQPTNPPVLENDGDGLNIDNHEGTTLVGLGIDTDKSATSSAPVTNPPALEIVTSGISRLNASPRQTRSAYSAISHSSSQESIILSIASSIMSTQRSSISSISVSEFVQSGKSDRSSVAPSTSSPLLSVHVQKPARPESSCLPSALLHQMNTDAQKAARPDSTCLPSMPASKRNSIVAKVSRPESACLSRVVPETPSVSDTKTTRGQRRASKQVDAKVRHIEEDDVSDLPSDMRNLPGARNSASSRASTTTTGDGSHSAHQRTSTSSSRTKQGRASYSLFPIAGPAASNSNIEVQSVSA